LCKWKPIARKPARYWPMRAKAGGFPGLAI
jgi:hypothetical protein